MSVSGGQMQRRSDIQLERKEMLLCVERGNKADIHAYTSGHLGPHSFSPRPVHRRQGKPIWEKSRYPSKYAEPSHRQESREMEAKVEEMIDALYNFTMATTLQAPDVLSSPLWTTSVDPYKEREIVDTTELLLDRQVVRKEDLISRNCLSGRAAAERHKRKLQQELSKVPACRGPCRERLAVFSDVFSDVCDGSPAFGSILREIKTEYDLYLNSVMSSWSPLQDMSAFMPTETSSETAQLEEEAQRVSLLEEEARRALEENERARTEYEDAQTKVEVMENLLEKEGLVSLYAGQYDLTDVEDGGFPGGKQSETQMEYKRRQVWTVWKEVQSLQKEIRETMVSTVTTSSLMGFIRDTELLKAEIMRLIASNEQLKSTNKDLEQNISKVLHRAKVSEEKKEKLWEKILTTVD
ncbi:uncharacterized protein [Salminus brasiliensis]|uniref:uncharacterized protein n=1 Tax=Salminus brasiliensis TaxID=930266 RepID=UPI003B8398F6